MKLTTSVLKILPRVPSLPPGQGHMMHPCKGPRTFQGEVSRTSNALRCGLHNSFRLRTSLAIGEQQLLHLAASSRPDRTNSYRHHLSSNTEHQPGFEANRQQLPI